MDSPQWSSQDPRCHVYTVLDSWLYRVETYARQQVEKEGSEVTESCYFYSPLLWLCFLSTDRDKQIWLKDQFVLELSTNPSEDQEVILTDNPISRHHPVPWRCSLASVNSGWEVTGRASPHLSQHHWLPRRRACRLPPSHSLTPAESLQDGGQGKMRRAASQWAIMFKQSRR